MRKIVFSAVAVLLLLTGLAWAVGWRIAPEASRLAFAGTQAGSPFEGVFARFTVDLRFDPADLPASKAAVVIDMASARTGNAERDAAIQGADWFAVARFPEARFETTAFRRLGDDRWEAEAKLTIRDVTRPVVLPFTLEEADGATRAIGQLVIYRTDFGIGQGQWASPQWVGHEVTIRFDLRATRVP